MHPVRILTINTTGDRIAGGRMSPNEEVTSHGAASESGRAWRLRIAAVCLLLLATAASAFSQYDPSLYAGLRWRLIGPFRGGRVTAVAGVPGQTAVYYIGTPGGGVWK